MVSKKIIHDQLKKLGFNYSGWGRSEVGELPQIILPNEEIYECVNGIYDGGFALLVATNIRVLLVDKKPLNYLTVEDMRFDMISELDYNHRLVGADINISSGGKNLHFRSYNQPRLRKLMGHVQHCMAESKIKQDTHQEGQVQHLEQINKQLQAYLIAQQQYQKQLDERSDRLEAENKAAVPEPPKPSNELADYLFAQSLMAKHSQRLTSDKKEEPKKISSNDEVIPKTQTFREEDNPTYLTNSLDLKEILSEAKKEVYSKKFNEVNSQNRGSKLHLHSIHTPHISLSNPLEINPIQIAISKLPMLIRERKFGKGNIQTNNISPETFLSRA